MSVRLKALLVVIGTLLGLLSGLALVVRAILLDSYAALEHDNTQRNLERALNALQDNQATLARTAVDYATWDDSYEFIASGDPSYIETNFIDSTFINNHLNGVLFVNTAHEIVYGQGFDLLSDTIAPLPAAWQATVFADPTLLVDTQADTAVVGLTVLDGVPYLVAAQPILTSAGEGPVRGTLIMARVLDEAEIQRLAETTRLDLRLEPYSTDVGVTLPPDLATATVALTPATPTFIQPVDDNYVMGYALLTDLRGTPAQILQVKLARSIYQQGLTSLNYLMGALLVAGVVFGLVVSFLLERIVLARLTRLNAEVAHIGASGDFAGRVTEKGRDELGQLGHSINQMLGTLARLNGVVLAEQEKAERLLLNVLPTAIADRLKRSPETIAESFPEVTIMFADIVDFTLMSAQTAPEEMVHLLNAIFSTFDELAERYQLEKIKTIGDAYMVVGGLPLPRADHATAVAEMALEMQAALNTLNQTRSHWPIEVRIGINTGPVVAGVIGTKKFLYDLWGDTVNTASRMEAFGVRGRIQVTEATYQRLREQYEFEGRGVVNIKGKGEMTTYFLVGRKASNVQWQ